MWKIYSMVDFVLKFRTLATESQWNKPALKAAFRRGLNNDILTEQACQDDEAMLDSLIDLSIRIDNLLWDWNSMQHQPLVRKQTTAELMQLGNARLSPQEHARRRNTSQCFYCRVVNHHIAQCTERSQHHNTPSHTKSLWVNSFIL